MLTTAPMKVATTPLALATMEAGTTMTPLSAPETPMPKANVAVKINASFADLGLDDAETKANFSRDFEDSMSAELGGNKVTVINVTAGEERLRL